jgi:hypothetical protein
MIDEMNEFIHKALLGVLSRWEEIAGYFDEILSEKKGLLNLKYHDSLLTDDGTFSRSKKYFWAIGFLEEVGCSISDNIYQVERFVEFMKLNALDAVGGSHQFQSRIKKHCGTIQKLHSLRMRFKHKKEEAMALRDGVSRGRSTTCVILLISYSFLVLALLWRVVPPLNWVRMLDFSPS